MRVRHAQRDQRILKLCAVEQQRLLQRRGPHDAHDFGPYYFLAVLALCTHVGCALYWNLPPRQRALVLASALVVGVLLAATLVMMLAGRLQGLEILLAIGPCGVWAVA